MQISLILIFFREYKNWQPAEVAGWLGLSIESYQGLEKGGIKVTEAIAERLSLLYQAPKEIFLIDDTPYHLQAEVIYHNCTIISGSNGISGYVNHQYQDRGIDEIMCLRKEEVRSLQHQIEELNRKNTRLIEILRERVKEDQM